MRDDGRNNAGDAERTGGRRALPSGAPAVALSAGFFGLFTFILMGAGVQGDDALAGSNVDAVLYNAREGMLLAGFVLYGLFARRRPCMLSGREARLSRAVLAVLFAACAAAMLAFSQGVPLIIGVLVMALLVGFTGGAVYEETALFAAGSAAAGRATAAEGGPAPHSPATRMLGLVVGIGGALAVVAQYALQLELDLGEWFAVLLAGCFCLLMHLMGEVGHRHQRLLSQNGTKGVGADVPAVGAAGVRKQVLYLIVVVGCLFALFNFYEVVIRDAFTWAVFYRWHRLFLAAGYLVIGAAAFFGGRPAASLVVAIGALFTAFVLAQTAMLQVDDFTMALFYALLGAVIAYYAIAFMSLAPQTACAALVASMGRIVEGAFTIAEAGIVSLAGEWPASTVLLAALVLIAVMIALMVSGGFLAFQTGADSRNAVAQGQTAASADAPEPPAEEPHAAAPDDGARIAAIGQRYGLTRRESEVLALVLRGMTAQQMADELVVTKSTAKFHVTNILKKTGTQTRQQLLEKLADEM